MPWRVSHYARHRRLFLFVKLVSIVISVTRTTSLGSPINGPTVEACTSRALPDLNICNSTTVPHSHKSKKMLPRKRDSSHSHTKGSFSGPALTIMSFNVDGLSAAKQ